MGNCMGCKRRGGRRTKVQVIRRDTVPDADQISIILSRQGSAKNSRPASREEAAMVKDLNNEEEPRTFAENVAYVLGLDDCVKEYTPELNSVIKSISEKYLGPDYNANLPQFEYSVEEEATLGKVIPDEEIEAGKRKLAEKQKRADEDSQSKVKKRKKFLGRKRQVEPISTLVESGKLHHDPVESTFTEEEARIMRNIVIDSDRQLQKREIEKKMSDADARREMFLASKSKKAKSMAKKEPEVQLPSMCDVAKEAEARPEMQASSAIAITYTKEEEAFMQGIVDEDDKRIRMANLQKKMEEAEARKADMLRQRSQKAKKMSGSSCDTEVTPTQTSSGSDEQASEQAKVPSSPHFTKTEENLMDTIVTEFDLNARKEAHSNKMARAEQRRQDKLQKKRDKARKMGKSGPALAQSGPALTQPGTSTSSDAQSVTGAAINTRENDITRQVRRELTPEPRPEFVNEEDLMIMEIFDNMDGGNSRSRLGEG